METVISDRNDSTIVQVDAYKVKLFRFDSSDAWKPVLEDDIYWVTCCCVDDEKIPCLVIIDEDQNVKFKSNLLYIDDYEREGGTNLFHDHFQLATSCGFIYQISSLFFVN